MNWWMPAELHSHPSLLGLLQTWVPRWFDRPDLPLLVGWGLLLVSVTCSAVLLVRLNHRALRAVRRGHLGVRRAR